MTVRFSLPKDLFERLNQIIKVPNPDSELLKFLKRHEREIMLEHAKEKFKEERKQEKKP